MFRDILAATDGSTTARSAVRTAAALAAAHDAHLHLLTVVPERGQLPPAIREAAERERNRTGEPNTAGFLLEATFDETTAEQAGQAVLKEAEEIARDAGVAEPDKLLIRGDPARQILAQAERAKADLIVMGTRGHGGTEETFLGSIAEEVANETTASCLIVK